jgi:hypothetical protein
MVENAVSVKIDILDEDGRRVVLTKNLNNCNADKLREELLETLDRFDWAEVEVEE